MNEDGMNEFREGLAVTLLDQRIDAFANQMAEGHW